MSTANCPHDHMTSLPFMFAKHCRLVDLLATWRLAAEDFRFDGKAVFSHT